jgi:hypothetical protein
MVAATIVLVVVCVALAWLSYSITVDKKRHELLEESRIVQEFAARVLQANDSRPCVAGKGHFTRGCAS